jgi:hypothetical protein
MFPEFLAGADQTETAARKGRNIDGEKAFRFTEYRGKKKHLNGQIPVENKNPEGGCKGKFPGTFSPARPARPPPSLALRTFSAKLQIPWP